MNNTSISTMYPKGYVVPSGYIGFDITGRKMLYCTEEEYLESLYESQKEEHNERIYQQHKQ